MAYVNMTVDGQTKQTSQLNLVGADGTTKTALLQAVLEASDTGSSTPSSGGVESGTFTPSERVAEYSFPVSSKKSHFMLKAKTPSSIPTNTGAAFVWALVADEVTSCFCKSNNAGSAVETASGYATSTRYDTLFATFLDNEVRLTNGNAKTVGVSNTSKVLAVGVEYEWFAF